MNCFSYKIYKKKIFFFFWGGGGLGLGDLSK